MVTSGQASWKPTSIGGSTSTLTTSDAVMRIAPRTASASPEAVRTSASAAAAIASACGRSAKAVSVGARPLAERVNSGAPSSVSSASTWRPTVGWVSPSLRAAPERLPSSSTASRVR